MASECILTWQAVIAMARAMTALPPFHRLHTPSEGQKTVSFTCARRVTFSRAHHDGRPATTHARHACSWTEEEILLTALQAHFEPEQHVGLTFCAVLEELGCQPAF